MWYKKKEEKTGVEIIEKSKAKLNTEYDTIKMSENKNKINWSK